MHKQQSTSSTGKKRRKPLQFLTNTKRPVVSAGQAGGPVKATRRGIAGCDKDVSTKQQRLHCRAHVGPSMEGTCDRLRHLKRGGGCTEMHSTYGSLESSVKYWSRGACLIGCGRITAVPQATARGYTQPRKPSAENHVRCRSCLRHKKPFVHNTCPWPTASSCPFSSAFGPLRQDCSGKPSCRHN